MNLPADLPVKMPVLGPELLSSATIQAGLIFFVFFFFVLLMAVGRRFLIKSSMQGVFAGFIMGIIVVAGAAGGFVYLTKTYLYGEKSELLPPDLKLVLSQGEKNFYDVLGTSSERSVPTAQTVVSDYNDLGALDSELVKNSICKEK